MVHHSRDFPSGKVPSIAFESLCEQVGGYSSGRLRMIAAGLTPTASASRIAVGRFRSRGSDPSTRGSKPRENAPPSPYWGTENKIEDSRTFSYTIRFKAGHYEECRRFGEAT